MGRSKNPTFDIAHEGVTWNLTVSLPKDNQQHRKQSNHRVKGIFDLTPENGSRSYVRIHAVFGSQREVR